MKAIAGGRTRDFSALRPQTTGYAADRLLRNLVRAAGIGCAILFIVVGLAFRLQEYGDGSLFSYAVAAQNVWAFHWHNISGRIFVYLYCLAPAEIFVALTGNAAGGIALYGFLLFSAPLAGLAATYAADRSSGRLIFTFACASTALLCPLIFGFPTEIWMTHALFWPTLALCHFARGGAGRTLAGLALLALVFTHGAALIFAFAILATLLLRPAPDRAFAQAGFAMIAVIAVWGTVKLALPPDDYLGPVLRRAALHVFDFRICTGQLVLLLASALTGYGAAYLLARRITDRGHAAIVATAVTAIALVAYWAFFDQALHAENRYYLRTALIVFTPAFGCLAIALMLDGEGRVRPLFAPIVRVIIAALCGPARAPAAASLLAVVLLVHAVETAKFAHAWNGYRDSVRSLATGTQSDLALGDARFVSSQRIASYVSRTAWFSTTPYLSVLVAPEFLPARLVIDPKSNFFWLSCQTAQANAGAARAMPASTRALIAHYSCQHR